MLDVGTVPHAIVIGAGAVIVGNAAGLTVIILDTEAIVLPQLSVAVHVCVTAPPHAFGVAVNVDRLDSPVIKQPPVRPFVNIKRNAAGIAPHATVMAAGAVMVGNAAGETVINLDTEAIIL